MSILSEPKGVSRTIFMPKVPEPKNEEDRELYDYLIQQQEVISSLYNILTLRLNDILIGGSTGERPQAGLSNSVLPTDNRLFYSTTSNALYYDQGSAWFKIA